MAAQKRICINIQVHVKLSHKLKDLITNITIEN